MRCWGCEGARSKKASGDEEEVKVQNVSGAWKARIDAKKIG